MRLIDADALEKEGWILHRTIRVDKNTSEYQTKPLKQVPTIEPERKIGQWVEHNTGHSTYFDCSRCGCCAPCTETADAFVWKLSNYCPDCGAKMYEGENYEGNRWRRFETKSTRGCSRIMEDENQGEC